MVAIAGRAVRLGDNLYIASYRAWGAVEGFEGGVAKVRINGSGGQSRLVRVADGGLISGIRQAWWHEPLALDLPIQNITSIQQVVNLVAFLGLGQ